MKTKSAAGKRVVVWMGVVIALAWGGSAVGQGNPPWKDDVDANGQITQSWGTKVMAIDHSRPKRHPVVVIMIDEGVGRHRSLLSSLLEGDGPGDLSVRRLSAYHGFEDIAAEKAVGCSPHATHVAGIIGGNGSDFKGVFPSVPIVSITTHDSKNRNTVSTNCVDDSTRSVDPDKHALETALNRVYDFISQNWKGKRVSVVINLSKNKTGPDPKTGVPPTNYYSGTDSVGKLFKKLATPVGDYPGAVIVQSAGNYYDDACKYSYSDAESGMAKPKDGILVVGALDRNGQPVMEKGFWTKDSMPLSMSRAGTSTGSNYGKCVDVWAPGHEIYSTWGDKKNEDNVSDGRVLSDKHRTLSGTSMAAPHIAGLAAYLIATTDKATLTPAEVEQMIRDRSIKLGSKDKGNNEVLMPTYRYPAPTNIKAKPSVLFWVNALYGAFSLSESGLGNLKKTIHPRNIELGYDSSGATGGCTASVVYPSGPPDSLALNGYTWSSVDELIRLKGSGDYKMKVTCTGVERAQTSATAEITFLAPPSKLECAIVPDVTTIPHTGGIYSATALCASPLGSGPSNPFAQYAWSFNGQLQVVNKVTPPRTVDTVSHNFPPNNSNMAQQFTIAVTGTDSSTSGTATITVTQAAKPTNNLTGKLPLPPTSRPTCTSIIPDVSSIPRQGGYFTVRANCSPNSTSYTWIVNNVVQPGKGSSIGNQFPPNNSATVLPFTIVLTATNSAGTSNPVQITVVQQR